MLWKKVKLVIFRISNDERAFCAVIREDFLALLRKSAVKSIGRWVSKDNSQEKLKQAQSKLVVKKSHFTFYFILGERKTTLFSNATGIDYVESKFVVCVDNSRRIIWITGKNITDYRDCLARKVKTVWIWNCRDLLTRVCTFSFYW